MKKYQIIAAGVLTVIGIWTMTQNIRSGQRAEELQPEIAEKILRFHIRANSDEEADQQLKLDIRDEIGTLLGEELKTAENIGESKEIVMEKLPQIVETAQKVIWEEGYSYEVDAYLTTAYFPEKTYGAYTFPKGEYQALEVVIGEGQGHNWWCVLYPSMCFQGSVYEIVEEEAKENLREVLNEEEYEAVLAEENYEVRFFLADWLESWK